MSLSENDQNNIILEEKPKEDTTPQNNNNFSNNSDLSLIPEDSDETTSSSIKEQEQENQAELSEIETGNTNQPNFDEIINFSHTFLNYRITQIFPDRETFENSTFDLLPTNIFIYSGDAIDFQSITTDLENSEAIKTIRQRINSYKNLDVTNKITVIENIPYYVKTIGFKETVESIIPIISELTREKEAVYSRFFQLFPKFVDELIKFGDKSYFIIKDYLIKLISEFLVDNSNIKENIYKSICDGLIYLSKYIKSEDKGESVLAIAIKMAQDDNDELKRVSSMRLFGALIPYIDKNIFKLFIIPQVTSFADDPSANLRKEVANLLYNLSQNVSKEIFKKKILPLYQKLSKDTLWFVKKVAAENLPKITKLCDGNMILKNIMPIFKNFANDENVEVKLSLVEILGEFISLLNKNESNNFIEILDFYIKTVQKYSEKNKKEYKLILSKCAFNFPALLDFFGKDSWTELKSSFNIMAKNKDDKIKLPLAASIGDISNIIGGDLTEEELLEYVNNFFTTSQNSEIKSKILENLPKIIRQINSTNKKNSYLEFLKFMITNKETKWRKRKTYAKIIGKFNNCYPKNIIYKRVFPIAIYFFFDDISQVRFCSAKHNSKLILQLITGDDEYKEKTLIIIKSFAQSINYKYRQLFIYMCLHLFENEKIFNENISPLLIDLAYDQIPNVKIVLAKFINKILTKDKYKHLKNNDTIKKIVKILKNDKNKEVLNYMDQIKDIDFDDKDKIIDNEKNVNWKFKDNMKFVAKEFGITRNVPLYSIFKEDKFKNEEINKETNKEEEKKEIKQEGVKEENIKEENKIEEKEKEKEEEKKEENNKEEENIVIKENKKEEEERIEENKKEKEEEHKEENKTEEVKKEESETK